MVDVCMCLRIQASIVLTRLSVRDASKRIQAQGCARTATGRRAMVLRAQQGTRPRFIFSGEPVDPFPEGLDPLLAQGNESSESSALHALLYCNHPHLPPALPCHIGMMTDQRLRISKGGGERFDERSTEVRRLVKRDLTGNARDDVEAMSISAAAESAPKSLDELEKLFEASDIETLKVEAETPSGAADASKSSSSSSPFAAAGGASANPASPFGSTSTKAAASPFGSASSKGGASASPFGSSSSSGAAGGSPFGASSGIQEPKGLSPNMVADPVAEEPEGPFAFLGGLKAAQIVRGSPGPLLCSSKIPRSHVNYPCSCSSLHRL